MKIAILSIHSCPLGRLGSKDTGGMSVYIRELSRELGKRGHHVDVFTRLHDPRDGEIVPLGENARLIHLKVGAIREIPKLDVYPYLDEFACSVEDFRKRNNLHYDLIHSHYWLSGWGGKQLQIIWDIPHIIMFHTLGAVKNAIGVGEEEPQIRIDTEKELAQSCQRIIAATQEEKKNLIQYYAAPPEKITVIPLGVNLQIFKPVNKQLARHKLAFDSNKLVLFVGRIEPLKGIDNLVAAMSLMNNKKDTRLVIVGGDERSQFELDRLHELCRKLQIENMVTFIGTVNQEELPLYYSAADVCVVPSYHESFGLVALESLACGTPVIATRVGGVESFIINGENGYIIDDNSALTIADNLTMLFSQSIIHSDAEIIRTSIAHFNWSTVTDRIINEYEGMLNGITA